MTGQIHDWSPFLALLAAAVMIVMGCGVAYKREQDAKARAAALKVSPRFPVPTYLTMRRWLGQFGQFDLWLGMDLQYSAYVVTAIRGTGSTYAEAVNAPVDDLPIIEDGSIHLCDRALREAGRRAGWILPSTEPLTYEEV